MRTTLILAIVIIGIGSYNLNAQCPQQCFISTNTFTNPEPGEVYTWSLTIDGVPSFIDSDTGDYCIALIGDPGGIFGCNFVDPSTYEVCVTLTRDNCPDYTECRTIEMGPAPQLDATIECDECNGTYTVTTTVTPSVTTHGTISGNTVTGIPSGQSATISFECAPDLNVNESCFDSVDLCDFAGTASGIFDGFNNVEEIFTIQAASSGTSTVIFDSQSVSDIVNVYVNCSLVLTSGCYSSTGCPGAYNTNCTLVTGPAQNGCAYAGTFSYNAGDIVHVEVIENCTTNCNTSTQWDLAISCCTPIPIVSNVEVTCDLTGEVESLSFNHNFNSVVATSGLCNIIINSGGVFEAVGCISQVNVFIGSGSCRRKFRFDCP